MEILLYCHVWLVLWTSGCFVYSAPNFGSISSLHQSSRPPHARKLSTSYKFRNECISARLWMITKHIIARVPVRWGIYSHYILCMQICARVGYTSPPNIKPSQSFSWLRATFIDGWQLFHHNYFLSQKMNIDKHVNNCISYLHNLSTFSLLSYLFHFYLFIYFFCMSTFTFNTNLQQED